MNIWTYWEGPRLPYLDVCLRLMPMMLQTKGVEFTLVTPENANEYLPERILNPNYLELKQPALKADCIRAALLASYGGWWFDADTVALRNPLSLVQRYRQPECLYCTWTKSPRRILNGYIYFAKKSPLAKQWLQAVNDSLENPSAISWCSIGEGLLSKIVPKSPDALEVPRRLFLPVDIDSSVQSFFNPERVEDYMWEDTICFGLNHSWFLYHHKSETIAGPQAWEKGDSLFYRLMRKANFLVSNA